MPGVPWGSPVTSRLEETTSPPRTQLLLREAATWEQRAVFAALMEYAWSPDGATLATLEPMVGGRQQQVVLRSAVDGARIVVAPCHNCIDQLMELNKEYRLGVRILTVAELLADALIVPAKDQVNA